MNLFSSPSVLLASFGANSHQRTYLLRASSGDMDLGKLDRLDRLATDVAEGKLTPKAGIERVEAIVTASEPYGVAVTVICYLLASAGSSRLFGGGWREILVGGIIGLGLGALLSLARRFPSLGSATAPLAGIGAAAFANLATLWLGPYSVYIGTVTGLIVLLPGLSLTVAFTELATGHPISGTSRLANSGVLFLMLGFGIALGNQITRIWPMAGAIAEPVPLPDWTQWVALATAPLAFTVLFKARAKDAGWLLMAGVFAFGCARMGSMLLGPELGGFLAAFLVGLASNLFARVFKRPASLIQVPGIIFLVPGSIGFKSIASLLADQTLAGVETLFTMTIVAIALVAGLILANVVYPSKRAI